MKFETSAGGVVLRKTQDKFSKKNTWDVLLVQHSQHHGWGFPKGLVDEGEDTKTTALREVNEEGGVQAKIIHELSPAEYFYKLEGATIKKKVFYFLMEYLSGDPEDHDWEMEAANWVPIEKVEETLSFASDKKIFQAVVEYLKKEPTKP